MFSKPIFKDGEKVTTLTINGIEVGEINNANDVAQIVLEEFSRFFVSRQMYFSLEFEFGIGVELINDTLYYYNNIKEPVTRNDCGYTAMTLHSLHTNKEDAYEILRNLAYEYLQEIQNDLNTWAAFIASEDICEWEEGFEQEKGFLKRLIGKLNDVITHDEPTVVWSEK